MKSIVAVLLIFIGVVSCSEDESTEGTVDNFDRKAMLSNYADNIIIPGYENFYKTISSLETATSEFLTTTDKTNLDILRNTWKESYIAWQLVSMFQIGKAEEIAYSGFINIFPVNIENINANILSGTYDLLAISQQDEQGFGALDYMLYGLADTDEGIIDTFTLNETAASHKKYLADLVGRMKQLTTLVLDDWKGSYKDTFVNNNGSSATSSLDKLVNDYIYHYEKFLRAGKIGIPAGVFSKDPLTSKVEAFYAGDLSKTLFLGNLNAMQNFFNGKSLTNNISENSSISSYLNFLNSIKEGEDLSALINQQFEVVKEVAKGLDDNFANQITSNNELMLNTYDELQKNVIFLKVDMLQALSITVDYVDADGD